MYFKIVKVNKRLLRKSQTEEEIILWEELRNNKLDVKFRRQHQIGSYIADFYCPKLKLIIEMDGNPHKLLKQINHDFLRDKWLEENGYQVIRFWGSQVRSDLESVVEVIKSKILFN
jgi:very-short-patch-repair endonuclease